MIKHKNLWYTAMLIPTMLVFTLIFLYPTVNVVITSFTEWKLLTPRHFVGFDNYIRLFTRDRGFHIALRNTGLWVLLECTVHVGLGISMALLLYKQPRGWKLMRTAYYMPNVVSTSARAMMFANVFSPSHGLLNSILRLVLGQDYMRNWLNDPSTAFASVTSTWIFFAGLVMLIVLSDIVSIPDSILEAARIDGATKGQIDRMIVLPLSRNAISTCVIISATAKLKEFEMIYLTTGGGPGNLTYNLPLMVYKNAMVSSNYGYANAIGTLLIVMGFVVVLALSSVFKIGGGDGR